MAFPGFELRVLGFLGFVVLGLGFFPFSLVLGLGFRVWDLGLGFEVWDLGLGFEVWDLGRRFQASKKILFRDKRGAWSSL